jgi:hypothetical protein
LHRYAGITEDLLTIYPRNFEEDKVMHKSITEIFKDQAFKTCIQIEILIAMKYLQKARLNAEAAYDNWADDALSLINSQIQKLINCHKEILYAYMSFHY